MFRVFPNHKLLQKALGFSLFFIISTTISHAQEKLDDYLELSLQELLNKEITSVSKKKQNLNEVAAAVYVISQEDIKRSGATTLPDVLRMAPGLQVARIDANKWVISSRGFGGQYSNKLLVMIDGRTVYTPSFSGVYWEVQDLILDDIEHIEVIRGPGATIWGANAVNGVINIITKTAADTQGGLVSLAAGNEEKATVNLRYGFKGFDNSDARIYFKYNKKDDSYAINTSEANNDSMETFRSGFRIDKDLSQQNKITFQGDTYKSQSNQVVDLWQDPQQLSQPTFSFLQENISDRIESTGLNLIFKWHQQLSPSSHTNLQLYYDHYKRSEEYIEQAYDTIDIEFQHHFQPFDKHDLIWGLGYRYIRDKFDNTFNTEFTPDDDQHDLFSAFIQDEIEIIPNTVFLTLGTKFEHNQYTGNEIQPSIRAVWKLANNETVWGAISRAVRTPSRMEYSGQIVTAIFPVPPSFEINSIYGLGNNDFESEKLLSYELGYRVQPRDNLSLDFALFYNDYDKLQGFSLTSSSPFSNYQFDNNISAYSYGFELSLNWHLQEWWKIQSNYSYININANLHGNDLEQLSQESFTENNTPQNLLSIRSLMDIKENISLDLWLYYADRLAQTSSDPQVKPIDSYYSFNARLAWQINDEWEVSLVGQNLFDRRHPEFFGELLLTNTEVERSVYAQILWAFK